MLSSIAFGLPWDQPAQAERFLSEHPPDKGRSWLTPTVTWKIATLDPKRARQLVDSQRDHASYF